jgi:hypothetical protein
MSNNRLTFTLWYQSTLNSIKQSHDDLSNELSNEYSDENDIKMELLRKNHSHVYNLVHYFEKKY